MSNINLEITNCLETKHLSIIKKALDAYSTRIVGMKATIQVLEDRKNQQLAKETLNHLLTIEENEFTSIYLLD